MADVRTLAVVFGDQLDPRSAALDGLERTTDAVWMAEAAGEATHAWSTKARIAVFLAAMRHFRDARRGDGWRVEYTEVDEPDNAGTLEGELRRALARLSPERLVAVEPGEYRVREMLVRVAGECGVPLEVRDDGHFLCSRERFARHAGGKKSLRMEFFYREMRREHGVLMDGSKPTGGEWNFDAANRGTFGKAGPQGVPAPVRFEPDAVTRGVIDTVDRVFEDHPGTLDAFDWPVTPEDALVALNDFVEHRLPSFGRYQDAMWTDEPWLYHARISAAMNLKLLDPREPIRLAEAAYRAGRVPLEAAEGFIRQILGWREYVRGVYWHFMPEYATRNALGADRPLPAFYWTGRTHMNCLSQCIRQTLDLGYAHHIQRLMVTGLFALLLGVRPGEINEWYLGVYVDAVEWVELPNVHGMSQYADGGTMASKPYVATGKYIQRMSNYCAGCRYDPAKSVGEDACPFTTLYWDFLARHADTLKRNVRMSMQLKNLERLDADDLAAIRQRADEIREALA